MRLGDLVKMEDLADLDVECASSDLFGQVLKGHPYEVFRFACIRCQTDRSGYHLHRSEILEGPLVADDSGHAHDTALFGAAKRVLQRRRTNQFEHFEGLASLRQTE